MTLSSIPSSDSSQQSPVFLPKVEVPKKIVLYADCFGVDTGLDKLKSEVKELATDVLASSAITIMEGIYEESEAKVRNYISFNGFKLVGSLTETAQKIELLIRMAKLLGPNKCVAFRDMATSMLPSDSFVAALPRPLSLDMAKMYIQTGDIEMAKQWMQQSHATWSECKEVVGLLYQRDNFEEGVKLFDTFSHLREEHSGKTPDFIELFTAGLKNKDLGDNESSQEALSAYLGERKIYIVIINALCHLNKIEAAIAFATRASVKNNTISPLSHIRQYVAGNPELYPFYKQRLEDIASQLGAYKELCMYGGGSDEELLDLLSKSGLSPEDKYEILKGRVYKKKNNGSSSSEIKPLLLAKQEALTAIMDGPEYSSDWREMIIDYFNLGMFEEVEAITEAWKTWYASFSQEVRENNHDSIRFLGTSGIMRLGMGNPRGLEDLEYAYEAQKAQWEKMPQAYNNYYAWTSEALDHVRNAYKKERLIIFLPETFFALWKQKSTHLTFEDISSAYQ